MVLESINDENINIKDLSFEAEGNLSLSVLNLEKYISDDDWEDMIEDLENNITKTYGISELNQWSVFGGQARSLCLINPLKKSNLNLDQDKFSALKHCFEYYSNSQNYPSAAGFAVDIQTLYPEKLPELTLDNEFKEDFQKTINDVRQYEANIIDFQFYVSSYKYLFGDDPKIGLDDATFHYVKNSWKDKWKQNNWHWLILSIAELKLLFPDKSDEISLTNEQISTLKKYALDLKEQGSWNDFTTVVAYLKIIAAKKINFTEHGLELIMDENDFQPQNTPPLPEQRSF